MEDHTAGTGTCGDRVSDCRVCRHDRMIVGKKVEKLSRRDCAEARAAGIAFDSWRPSGPRGCDSSWSDQANIPTGGISRCRASRLTEPFLIEEAARKQLLGRRHALSKWHRHAVTLPRAAYGAFVSDEEVSPAGG